MCAHLIEVVVKEHKFEEVKSMILICDNQAAFHIIFNIVFMRELNIFRQTLILLERRSNQKHYHKFCQL